MTPNHCLEQKTSGLPPGLQEHLTQLLSAWPQIEKVVLFGSRTREDATERADVDLAVVAPTATQRQWLDISFQLEEANTLRPIDVVRWEEAPHAKGENSG